MKFCHQVSFLQIFKTGILSNGHFLEPHKLSNLCGSARHHLKFQRTEIGCPCSNFVGPRFCIFIGLLCKPDCFADQWFNLHGTKHKYSIRTTPSFEKICKSSESTLSYYGGTNYCNWSQNIGPILDDRLKEKLLKPGCPQQSLS